METTTSAGCKHPEQSNNKPDREDCGKISIAAWLNQQPDQAAFWGWVPSAKVAEKYGMSFAYQKNIKIRCPVMPFRSLFFAFAVTAALGATPAFATAYGVYGAATAASVSLITAQGDTASVLTDLSAASLTGINVLWVLNGVNGAQPTALGASASDITSFVSAGGTFSYNDRNVTDAALALPGGSAVSFTRLPTDTINVTTPGTLLTSGPGGPIDDTNLEGGLYSEHGYADVSTLPFGATALLNDGYSTDAVAFSYQEGAGHVYYAAIPLDRFLGTGNNFDTIYAPNLVAYLDDLSATPVPEPASMALLSMGLLGLCLARRRPSFSTQH